MALINIVQRNVSPVVLAAILFWIVSPAITPYFHVVDDHEIARYLSQPVPLATQLQDDLSFGRFRPLYYAVRAVEIILMRDNAILWHLVTLLFGVVTLALFYAALLYHMPARYAFLACFLILTYPLSPAIWWRLGPQETIGSLLTVGAFFAWTRRRLWVMVLLAILAGFYKESFALLIPAWIAMIYLVDRGARLQIFALLAFFIALMGFIGLSFLTGGHGASATAGVSVLQNIGVLFFSVGFGVPLLLYLLYRRTWTMLALLVLWVAPQILLYRSGIYERYQYPAILGIVAITSYCLYGLRRYKPARAVSVALLSFNLLIGCLLIINQRSAAVEYEQAAREFQQMVMEIVEADPPLVELPYTSSEDEEPRYSVVHFLRWRGYTGVIRFGTNCTGLYCNFGENGG